MSPWFDWFEIPLHPLRVVAGEGEYGHYFGGPPQACKPIFDPITRVLHLDTSDPALQRLAVHVDYVPLLYPFDHDGAELFYRVSPPGNVTVIHGPTGPMGLDWPDELGATLPHTPARVERIAYEEHRALVFAAELGALEGTGSGHDPMSTVDRARLEAMGTPFAQVGGWLPMVQGRPWKECPFERCPGSLPPRWMQPVAVIPSRPVPGVSLWGEKGSDTWLVYLICPYCGTMHVSSQCD